MPFGMVGSNSWSTEEREQSWLRNIMFIAPNSAATLTAITNASRERMVIDPLHNWFGEVHENEAGDITGVYTDFALSSAFTVGNGTSGQTLYVKMSASDAGNFVPGYTVRLRVGGSISKDIAAKVVGVHLNGASSNVAIRLQESDSGNSGSTYTRLYVAGNRNPEFGVTPEARYTNPTPYSTRSQIIRTPVGMSRTAMKTAERRGLRTGNRWDINQKRALIRHGAHIERPLIFGKKDTTSVGPNNQAEGEMMGILEFIKTYEPTHIFDPVTDTDFSVGTPWLEMGETFFAKVIREMKRFTPADKDPELLMLHGDLAADEIQKLAMTYGNFQLSEDTVEYGMQLTKWTSANGSLSMKSYALFTQEDTLRRSALLLYPSAITYCYVDDTELKEMIQSKKEDGRQDEFLTECAFQFDHPKLFGFVQNIGLDRASS